MASRVALDVLKCLYLLSTLWVYTYTLAVDNNGYVLYCPCMGRFGNQADQFLGSLAFARGLNRTLVLPPWVEYEPWSPRSIQVPFDKYFLVDPLLEYHRVMTMEQFMTELAPIIWPPGNRSVFCYGIPRGSSGLQCNAKDGNPFGPFWDTFDVDFDQSVGYGPLGYETWRAAVAHHWKTRFPPSQHLVMAFKGAPGSFPVDKHAVELHRYLHWSDYISSLADQFIQEKLSGKPFLGIHMRNGQDWEKVCTHTDDSQAHGMHLFASPQCLGYAFENGHVTNEMCFPSERTVVSQIKRAVERTKVAVVFVATDNDPMLQAIETKLEGKVKVFQRVPSEAHVDLAILAKAEHYIGNCISTFSAFAARERTANRRSVEFWAFQQPAIEHTDEL